MDEGDRVFCHACGGVWRRNEHGLICPHCGSDFTEIVCRGATVMRDMLIYDGSGQVEIPPDPDESSPRPFDPWGARQAWPEEDSAPEEGAPPGLSRHTFTSPDGSFTFSTATYAGGFPPAPPPRRGDAGSPPAPTVEDLMVRGLGTIFSGLAEASRRQNPDGNQNQVSRGLFGGGRRSQQHQHGTEGAAEELHPRNAEAPQPMMGGVNSLAEYVYIVAARKRGCKESI